jgi:hypothetical protein
LLSLVIELRVRLGFHAEFLFGELAWCLARFFAFFPRNVGDVVWMSLRLGLRHVVAVVRG